MNTNDGGPAFPHLALYPGADGNLHPFPTQYVGLSVRDYFAGQALVGLLQDGVNAVTGSALARDAYLIADHMLAARESK
jgi:hypothetical protein